MSFGIRSQLVLGLFGLLLVAVTIAALLLVYLVEGETESQVMSEQREHAQVIGRSLEVLCKKMPCPGAESLVALSQRGRLRIGVISPHGHPWLGGVHPSDRRAAAIVDAAQSGSLTWERINGKDDPARLSEIDQRVVLPLQLTGGQTGFLVARFSLGHVRQALAQRRAQVFFYLALDFLFVLLFGLYLSGQALVRPLRKLTDAVTELTPDSLSASGISLPLARGPAEIEQLADAFGDLITRLEASRTELAESLEILENTRDELVRSEKFATVGRLAASVAHEVGNPLAAVVGYLDYLRAESGLDAEVLDDLHRRMDGELIRIRTILRRLLDFSRPLESRPVPLHVEDVIRNVAEGHQFQSRFEGVEIEVVGQAPPAFMDGARLHQVFANLFSNAADAMGAGGHILIELSREKSDIVIRVQDSGPGIAPAQFEQVFEPFFTTKSKGMGTGLGLAISRRLVEEGGGQLTLAHAERGAHFVLRLPVAQINELRVSAAEQRLNPD